MFLAEIRNAAAKTKTADDSYNAGNGDTIIIDTAARATSDTSTSQTLDYLPGFVVNLSATPADGDTVRIIVKGYGHLTNAVSVRAGHPIDFRTTGVVPDGTYVNTYLGDNKTLILDDKNLETLFVYDGTNNRWDSNTSSASSNLNYRRLRPSETEMANNNVQLVTCNYQPGMWDNPFNYDSTETGVTQEDTYGWSAPTALSNWLGFIENRWGPFSTFGDSVDYPDSGTYTFGDAQWKDHLYDGARPASSVSYAQQTTVVTDFGWYVGTNGLGASDTATYWSAANAAYGTSVGNFVLGLRAWLQQVGEGALQANDVSVSYNSQDTAMSGFGEGYASTLMDNFDTNFQIVRDEMANDRPFFACFKHWNITQKTNPENKLAPETVGGTSLCKSLPIKFYSWGAAQTTGPNNEEYYEGNADDAENTVGHWALVVGYIETGASYATNANYTIHPHISPSSKYLIVVDELYTDQVDGTPNGISTLNGIDQRHLKAIPIIENGVTTNRANLLATVLCQITNATFAA